MDLRRARLIAQQQGGSASGTADKALVPAGPQEPPSQPQLLERGSARGRALWATLYDGVERTSIRFCLITCIPLPDGTMRMALHDAPPPNKPVGKYQELTRNVLVHDHVLRPLFAEVWQRYGDEEPTGIIIDWRGSVWVAARDTAIAQYLSRRPPADPGDERFLLPPWIVQLRKVASVFTDGDPFLQMIGAGLCVICWICAAASTVAWVLLAVLTLAAALGAYPVTGGFPTAIYYVLSIGISCAELAAFFIWESDLANKYLKPLMAIDIGYHFVRGLTVSAAGFTALAATPVAALGGPHAAETASAALPGVVSVVLPQTAEGWGYGVFSGIISALFAIVPQILMVSFAYMGYLLWPLLWVELPAAWRLRRVQMKLLRNAAASRLSRAAATPPADRPPDRRVEWVIDQHTNEVFAVQS